MKRSTLNLEQKQSKMTRIVPNYLNSDQDIASLFNWDNMKVMSVNAIDTF